MARRRYRPFLKTVAHTLRASAEVLWKDRRGALTPEATDAVLLRWVEQIFAAGEGSLASVGGEHLDPHTAYVLMTNHQSLLDVPSVLGTFPGRVRMVGKRELGEVPVWGHAMKAIGTVFVDRGDRERAIAALERAKAQLLAQGTSVWIAPEGTRSRDLQLGPFKKGGFHLARSLGAPIATAWISGTAHIVAPDSFGVHKGGRVTVRYGRVFPTAGTEIAPTVEELMELVRAELLRLQQEAIAAGE
jgi:1-acyl-sn-glycerol-3-phosphate acyltransferase